MATTENNVNDPYIDKIPGYFDTIGQQRIAELNNANVLMGISAAAQLSEQKRLAAKYGDNDPGAILKGLQAAALQQVMKSVDLETARSSTKPVSYDPSSSALIQGVVYKDGQPLGSTNISLVNDKNEVLNNQYSCTGADGTYDILLNKESLAQLEQTPYFLQATDSNKKTIFRDKDRIALQAGQLLTKNIYINSMDCAPT